VRAPSRSPFCASAIPDNVIGNVLHWPAVQASIFARLLPPTSGLLWRQGFVRRPDSHAALLDATCQCRGSDNDYHCPSVVLQRSDRAQCYRCLYLARGCMTNGLSRNPNWMWSADEAEARVSAYYGYARERAFGCVRKGCPIRHYGGFRKCHWSIALCR
jgi:hypothetical protein